MRRALVVAATAAGALAVTSGSALAMHGTALRHRTPVNGTVGQTGAPVDNAYLGHNEFVVPSYAVPAGGGTVTSFQTQSGTCEAEGSFFQGTFDFQVLRPEGAGQYLVVGHTGDETDPCDGNGHSYPVNIAVNAGDILGVYVVSTWAGVLPGNGTPILFGFQSEPSVGQTVTVSNPESSLPDESATVVSAALTQLLALYNAVQGVGPGHSLAAKIGQAIARYEAGSTSGTCSILSAFVHEVNAQTGKKIPAATANQFLADAVQIEAELGC
jgi:hypothetical protein